MAPEALAQEPGSDQNAPMTVRPLIDPAHTRNAA
jgi:hypothetical protein